jgi:hypothetical protein
MGTLGGFRSALGTRHPPCHPLAALGLAKPSRALAPGRQAVGEARLRRRDDGTDGSSGFRHQPPDLPTPRSAKALGFFLIEQRDGDAVKRAIG